MSNFQVQWPKQRKYVENLLCIRFNDVLVTFLMEFWKVGPWKDREEIRDIFPWDEGCLSCLLILRICCL